MSYKQKLEHAKREQEEEYSVSADFATQPGHYLSEEEKHIIENKGTEPAGSGAYDRFFPGQGYFACRKCGAPIYSYEAKFKTGCGWPAFDKCYTGSIKMRREEDDRVEIMCLCGAHLGHVFDNEGLSKGGQRHCANSRSLQYIKATPTAQLTQSKLDTDSV